MGADGAAGTAGAGLIVGCVVGTGEELVVVVGAVEEASAALMVA